jgi:hypothetical protein
MVLSLPLGGTHHLPPLCSGIGMQVPWRIPAGLAGWPWMTHGPGIVDRYPWHKHSNESGCHEWWLPGPSWTCSSSAGLCDRWRVLILETLFPSGFQYKDTYKPMMSTKFASDLPNRAAIVDQFASSRAGSNSRWLSPWKTLRWVRIA